MICKQASLYAGYRFFLIANKHCSNVNQWFA